ncbi:hypothetical protein V1511DRAFT_495066 [Dipodascopsis uninucleata]
MATVTPTGNSSRPQSRLPVLTTSKARPTPLSEHIQTPNSQERRYRLTESAIKGKLDLGSIDKKKSGTNLRSKLSAAAQDNRSKSHSRSVSLSTLNAGPIDHSIRVADFGIPERTREPVSSLRSSIPTKSSPGQIGNWSQSPRVLKPYPENKTTDLAPRTHTNVLAKLRASAAAAAAAGKADKDKDIHHPSRLKPLGTPPKSSALSPSTSASSPTASVASPRSRQGSRIPSALSLRVDSTTFDRRASLQSREVLRSTRPLSMAVRSPAPTRRDDTRKSCAIDSASRVSNERSDLSTAPPVASRRIRPASVISTGLSVSTSRIRPPSTPSTPPTPSIASMAIPSSIKGDVQASSVVKVSRGKTSNIQSSSRPASRIVTRSMSSLSSSSDADKTIRPANRSTNRLPDRTTQTQSRLARASSTVSTLKKPTSRANNSSRMSTTTSALSNRTESSMSSTRSRPVTRSQARALIDKQEYRTSSSLEGNVQTSLRKPRPDFIKDRRKSVATFPIAVADASRDHFGCNTDHLYTYERKELSNSILKRIKSSKNNNQLDLSSLGLTEFPLEVYEILQDDSQINIEKITAADNAISLIDDDFAREFPQLKVLDLNHNILRKLPLTFDSFYHITSLDLSSNKLTNTGLKPVFSLTTLIDLNLQANKLDGELPADISNLTALEKLDLSANEFISISGESLVPLGRLKRLNLKSNRLRSFPFEAIERSSIYELNLSYNRLSGSLISINRMSRFANLKVLKASHNMIKIISDFAIILPSLEYLNLDSNCIVSLGMFLLCTPSLISLQIARNMIPTLPDGLDELKNLRTLDVSMNALTKLDPKIGFMEALESLKWEGNKFGERKLAAMSIVQVKKQLRERYEQEQKAKKLSSKRDIKQKLDEDSMQYDENEKVADSSGSEVSLTDLQISRRMKRVRIKPMVLDLSGREYSVIPDYIREQYASGNYMSYSGEGLTELHMQRNNFSTVPQEIMAFAFSDSLKSVNLSHNNLDIEAFAIPITLQSLQEFNVSCNSIVSLDMLIKNYDLPRLTKLNLSFNRIANVPNSLVKKFPMLEELNLHENKVTEISASSFKGLEKIDLSNNSIGYLPPDLAKIKTIVELKVQGNIFKTPRWQVVEKGTDAILDWLRLRIPEEDIDKQIL